MRLTNWSWCMASVLAVACGGEDGGGETAGSGGATENVSSAASGGASSSKTSSVSASGGSSSGGSSSGGSSSGGSSSGGSSSGGSSSGGSSSGGSSSGGSSSGGSSSGGSSNAVEYGCVIRVAADSGSDSNDGSNWDAALASLQVGLEAADSAMSSNSCTSVEIWVAAGTYSPTFLTDTADARTATFQLRANVALYGGFAGTELDRDERNVASSTTTLSGDVGVADDSSDNSYHVVTGVTGATLDGFTITAGNADGTNDTHGGGMYNVAASPTVANCTFVANSGHNCGAMYNYNASPTVTDCTFDGNSTDINGGGIYNYNASPTVTRCTFSGNSAGAYGGGLYNYSGSSPAVTDCVFTNNTARYFGGGLYNESNCSPLVTNCLFALNVAGSSGGGLYNTTSSSPVVTNCTFSGNSATDGGGAICSRNSSSAPTVTNSILWGNEDESGANEIANDDSARPVVTNCIVQGGYADGTNIIDTDPLFANSGNADFHLSPSSPAIDSGDGCAANVTLIDLEGSSRWDLASVSNATNGLDLGAFEYQGAAGTDSVIGAFDCS